MNESEAASEIKYTIKGGYISKDKVRAERTVRSRVRLKVTQVISSES
jgi:hypothetical protein